MLPSRFIANPFFIESSPEVVRFDLNRALSFHHSLPFYQPTPLVRLPNLARKLRLKNIFVKDESHRFGLNAFKAIGASYAIYRFLDEQHQARNGEPLASELLFSRKYADQSHPYTFTTATDGNHGRAVAWVARQLGQRAVIYVPENMKEIRKQAIEAEKAEVIMVAGHYDAAVAQMARDAEQNGWQIISDTAWPGYEQIPHWIMEGYQTIFYEADQALASKEKPDIVLIQAGVGGLAAAAAGYYVGRYPNTHPKLVCVEPLDADCLLESIASGKGEMAHAKGQQNSIMSGLNCGTPSSLAWPIVKSCFHSFLAIDDTWAARAMRTLFHAHRGDQPVVAGETGAAGLAGLLALYDDPALGTIRDRLHLTDQSTIMVINTEGDTDPEHFQEIIRQR